MHLMHPCALYICAPCPAAPIGNPNPPALHVCCCRGTCTAFADAYYSGMRGRATGREGNGNSNLPGVAMQYIHTVRAIDMNTHAKPHTPHHPTPLLPPHEWLCVPDELSHLCVDCCVVQAVGQVSLAGGARLGDLYIVSSCGVGVWRGVWKGRQAAAVCRWC